MAVSFDLRGGIAFISIDSPPANALSKAVRSGLRDALRRAGASAAAGVVLHGSAKVFIAGADIDEMDRPPDDPLLPDLVREIEALPMPVVAAIGGAALGGGLEIAMACDARVAAPDARLGLPEVNLGLIPGAGGTQRLPRLVGFERAVEMITGGRILLGAEALEAGLVDELAPDVLLAAERRVRQTDKRPVSRLPVPTVAEDDVARARGLALRNARRHVSAPVAFERIADALSLGWEDALARERETFLRLREGEPARALRYLFKAERAAQHSSGTSRPVETVAVIGGGTMGSGIAAAIVSAGLQAVVIERSDQTAEQARSRLGGLIDEQVRRGACTGLVGTSRKERARFASDFAAVAGCDLVIEAAFEDADVKGAIFDALAPHLGDHTLVATNTSYLDIDRFAANVPDPGRFLGLHFFAPAHVMKLVEIVRGAATTPETLARGLAFARRLGKTSVIAGNSEGFIGNRIYADYRRHLEYMVEDGASPYEIDAALEAYGFALGPFAVFDMSGLDIAWAMRKRRAATRSPQERYVAIADRLCEAGRLGQKTHAGWYDHVDGRRQPSPFVLDAIAAARRERGTAPRAFSAAEIVTRVLAVMANSGADLLEKGIAARAGDIDVVMVNGYGFPRHKGGPMFAADMHGLAATLEEARRAALVGGAGSEVSPLLERLALESGSFAGGSAGR